MRMYRSCSSCATHSRDARQTTCRKARQNRRSLAEGCNFFVYNFSSMLRFLSAGESHGQALVITLDGFPAGLDLDVDALNAQLRRRQGGYGRGRRMAIESDRAEILAGVRHGRTTGAPIAMLIRNRDWVNWQQTMYVEREMPEASSGTKRQEVTR